MTPPTGFAAMLRLYFDIALCRRGPQDVPASAFLLWATLAAYLICNVLLGAAMPPMVGSQPAYIIADAALMLAWYKGVLAAARHTPRFVQTAAAYFGYQLLLTPLFVPVGWLSERYARQPGWELPLSFLQLALLVWTLAVNGRILRLATQWPMAACVVLVLLQIMLQLLLLQFFPQP